MEHAESGGGSGSVEGQSKSATRDADRVKREKRRVWKNVVAISVAFLFIFNAFHGLGRLQSTLNRVEGMGVLTLSVLNAMMAVSCMFTPRLMILCLGHRWTMVVSFVGYILYTAANGYAVWGTMITASVLVGLSAAPLWTAQCSYFIVSARHYERLTGQAGDIIVSRFFGVFFMIFQACKLIALRGRSERGLSSTQNT